MDFIMLLQHWYKDEKYSTKVKDEDGYPSFALVNKATGKAMKHPISGEPVSFYCLFLLYTLCVFAYLPAHFKTSMLLDL